MNPRVAVTLAVAIILAMELGAAFMVGVPLWAVVLATGVFLAVFWLLRRRKKRAASSAAATVDSDQQIG